jgi:hypothetical protein
MNETLLYNDLKAVIPAPYQVRDKLRRESRLKRLDSGLRRELSRTIKSGITKYVKSYLNQWISLF